MARALNRLLGRNHQFWARRYSAEPVLDHGAAVDRLGYTEANPSNANLIDTASDWPGLSSHHTPDGTRTQKFVFFNRTRWHRNHKPKNLNKYLEVVEVTIDKLPGCQHMSDPKYADFVKNLIAEREADIRRKRTGWFPRGTFRSATERSGRPNRAVAEMDCTRPVGHPVGMGFP